MNEKEHKSGLYRWQRQTKPKVYSRSQRVATKDDVEDWIKKVEDASVIATDTAFGLVTSGKERGQAAAQIRSKHVRDQEETYLEAQELLNQWVNNKIHFDEDDGLDDLEAWRRARYMKKKEVGFPNANNSHIGDEPENTRWPSSRVMDESWEVDETAIYERVKRAAIGDEDPYAGLLEMDEKDAVTSVLQAMMSKEVIKDTFKRNVDDAEINVPDPHTKMELRHHMVKENREKRQKKEKRELEEKRMKKEARLCAQQMILREQREKDNKTRREEAEIKQEMAKIRKELTEDTKRKGEALRRDRAEKELLARLAKEELERQTKVEEEQLLLSHRSESERRKKQLVKEGIWRTKQESKRLKTLHSHFTAWYNLTLSQRLLMGKVKAMSDWKVMVKVWCAWKSYVREQRVQLEVLNHEKQVIDAHRKSLMAERHYNNHRLRRCLEGWKSYVQVDVERKAMEKERERTKAKMMALLSAVAEGTIKSDSGVEESQKSSRSDVKDQSRMKKGRISNASRPEKTIQAWLDPNDCVEGKLQDAQPSPSPATSMFHHPSTVGGRIPHPTQPWQVNRKHVRMDVEDIRNLGHPTDGDGHGKEENGIHYTDAEIRKRFGTQPWMNRHYVINNYEHRYMAQQKALKEQQGQIKEQRRMIEELKYQQHHQQLQQSLKHLGPNIAKQELHKELEAPPKGEQITKDDGEVEKVDTNGILSTEIVLNNANNNHQSPEKLSPFNEHLKDSENQALESDRSNLTASKSKSTSSTVSIPQGNTKYLQILKNMEERATQRARLKTEREEKRRKQEEEKLAELERLEEERLKEIEEEKRAKVEAHRMKKRMEKQKEEDRQREVARQLELNQKADEHYRRALLKFRCLLPLKKLVGLSKRNWVKATKHHNHLLLRQLFSEWKLFSDTEIRHKQHMADQMAEFLLVKHSFQRWKKYKYHSDFLFKRAGRHFNTTLKLKVFQSWTEYVIIEKKDSVRNEEIAHEHYLNHLVKSSFLAWRYLPEQQKRDEERKKRKLELRQRVTELIPDFIPSHSPGVTQDLLNQ